MAVARGLRRPCLNHCMDGNTVSQHLFRYGREQQVIRRAAEREGNPWKKCRAARRRLQRSGVGSS